MDSPRKSHKLLSSWDYFNHSKPDDNLPIMSKDVFYLFIVREFNERSNKSKKKKVMIK